LLPIGRFSFGSPLSRRAHFRFQWRSGLARSTSHANGPWIESPPDQNFSTLDTEFDQLFVIIQYSKLALRNHAEITIERIFAFRVTEAQGRIQRSISGR
jgi:hypothetical protein